MMASFFIISFVATNLVHSADLTSRLKGKILLQVESKGEAWYVNPDDNKRHYLGTAEDAFGVMRNLGLGISGVDFERFDGIAPERLSGKILLNVDDGGKAYYVNPEDLKMYYLGKAQDAFNVMRNLGLGITNDNLGGILSAESTPVAVDNNAPSTNQGSSSESEGNSSKIREYLCPQLLEYEFTRPEDLSSFIGGFVSSGPPVLRFSHAEVEDGKLACVYEDRFADSHDLAVDTGFAFFLTSANKNCPTSLGLNIRDKENIAPDWKMLYPGYVKVDKTHSGHKGVAVNVWQSDVDWMHTYDGCVYSKTLQEDSDPTLRRTKYGSCIVNDDNNGFRCADSLMDLYGATEAVSASPLQ